MIYKMAQPSGQDSKKLQHTQTNYQVKVTKRIILPLALILACALPAFASTKQLVWVGADIVEERNASDTVTKRFYPQGEQIGSTSYYYTRDHLGSVRELLNSSQTVQARYDYDPYGRTTSELHTPTIAPELPKKK
jgi:hypothetical protein